MRERLDAATVGDIVAADYRTAGIFEQFGIDFCCGGRRSLADACRTSSADPAAVVRALAALPAPGAGDDDVTSARSMTVVCHTDNEVAFRHSHVEVVTRPTVCSLRPPGYPEERTWVITGENTG